jgi:hypothetical protein
VIGEDFGNGLAGRCLDLVIGIDERNAKLFSQPAAHAGLSGPHQAHQHDRVSSQSMPHGFGFFCDRTACHSLILKSRRL